MRNKLIVACVALVCVVAFGFAGWNVWSANQTLNDAKAAVEAAESGETNQNDEKVPVEVQDNISEVTGLDSDRVAKDTRSFEEFCRTIFAWNSSKEYMEARDYCIEKGIPEDSRFMTEFFSPVHVGSDGKGPLEQADGSSLNMHYGKMDYQKVTKIDDGNYSYFVVITLTSDASYKDTEGNVKKVEGNSKAVMTYTMNADGQISNLDAYAIA